MNNTLVAILTFISITACNNDSSISNSSSVKRDSIDVLNEKDEFDEYEFEEQEMEKAMIQERKDHTIRMAKKSFEFHCTDNCESGDVSKENRKKYRKHQPFNIEKVKTDTSYIVQFRFIDDCCLEYVGDVKRDASSIRLTYKNISFTPCECYCEYEYQFDVKLEGATPSKIELNGKEI